MIKKNMARASWESQRKKSSPLSFREVIMALLVGPPRSHENGTPLTVFSHQCPMALLAGPPRRDENGLVSSPCRRRLCLVPQRKSPLHQCDAGASRHPELSPLLEHER